MRKIVSLLLLFFVSSCIGESKTTSTKSTSFKTLDEKIEFLKKYVTFRREYEELEFSIDYIDGSSGMVPGPTEYKISIYAKVPASKISEWVAGLTPIKYTDNQSWLNDIPNINTIASESFSWHQANRKLVGVNNKSQVVYHVYAN